MKILIINGPNLNLLGSRENGIYGNFSIHDIHKIMLKKAFELNVELIVFQSNYEEIIAEIIQESIFDIAGLIINPAGHTHNSTILRDALLLLKVPVIEVHLSNIYARETFRKQSMIIDVVDGHISGLGMLGYIVALEAIINFCL